MSKRYFIYAYKHYGHAGGIYENDIPMPYTADQKEFEIEASSEKEALAIAEKEYGPDERVDSNGQYKFLNPDGSWTLMGVKKVEILNSPHHPQGQRHE